MAIEVELATRNPAQFVDTVARIYEQGVVVGRTTNYYASWDLKQSPLHAGITEVDWLFGATLRDAGNSVMRITAATAPTDLAFVSMPGELEGWAREILGFASSGTSVFGADGVNALNRGGVAFLLVDSSAVGNSANFINFPNHYVDVRSWTSAGLSIYTWGRTVNRTWADISPLTYAVIWAS
jgi:hypothetical protein